MADRHELDITINDKGEVRISVSGVNGPRCMELTADLEQALGLVVSREKKSEFYKQNTQTDNEINLT